MNKAIKAVDYILRNTPGVTSIVGQNIYPVRALQGATYPYIAHQFLSNRPVSTHDGPSRFDFGTVQINIYAMTATQAQDIMEAVRTALDRKTPGTYNGTAVAQIEYLGESHLPEDEAENDQVYYIVSEFEVNYHR
jgi:hypothetical protein